MEILKELWFGNICPADDLRPFEACYMPLMHLCDKNQDRLQATLNDEQKAILQRLVDAWTELQLESQSAAFSVGFRLGVQLMTAAVSPFPEPITP